MSISKSASIVMYINYGKTFEHKYEKSIQLFEREWQVVILTIMYNLM